MLYEVITGRAVVGEVQVIGQIARIRSDMALIDQQVAQIQHVAAAGTGREAEVTNDVMRRLGRITSYNVCYTKLLRVGIRHRVGPHARFRDRQAAKRAGVSYNFV